MSLHFKEIGPTPEEARELNHKEYRSPSQIEMLLKRVAKGSAFVLGVGSSVLSIDALQSRPVSAASCVFTQGFRLIHDKIPDIVGGCLVPEHYNPQNGDALQETANGLMVWRKADNFTAFTDGYRTWVNGPNGIQVRLNTERFPWEEPGYQKQLPPVWQGREWPALSADVARNNGLHTLYESGGALDLYDRSSTLIGPRTNFRQQAENAAVEYFRKYANIPQILINTSGYCHGVANAAANGEPEPVGDSYMSKDIKIDLLAALHSGDSQYKPGIEQLVRDLKEKGIRFVIETQDETGFWSRVAYEVEADGSVKATDFNRPPIIISLAKVKNMYVPVPEGEEGNYPAGTVVPVPNEWKFGLNRDLVNFLVYGTPLN